MEIIKVKGTRTKHVCVVDNVCVHLCMNKAEALEHERTDKGAAITALKKTSAETRVALAKDLGSHTVYAKEYMERVGWPKEVYPAFCQRNVSDLSDVTRTLFNGDGDPVLEMWGCDTHLLLNLLCGIDDVPTNSMKLGRGSAFREVQQRYLEAVAKRMEPIPSTPLVTDLDGNPVRPSDL